MNRENLFYQSINNQRNLQLHQRPVARAPLFVPGGKILKRSYRTEKGWWYRAQRSDCQACPLRRRCMPETVPARMILIVDGYKALLRARRRKSRGWDTDTQRVYNRQRIYVEGVHGAGKTQHGLRRALRRGLANVEIQVYLIAAVINLKRLAKALSPRPYDGDWYLIIRNRLGAVIKQFFGDWVEKLYSALFCTA